MKASLEVRILDQITARMNAGDDVQTATVAAAKAAVEEARAAGWAPELADALGILVAEIGGLLAAEMLDVIDKEGLS